VHNLDEDPVIVLPCQHIYSVSTLDRVLEIDKVYEKDNASSSFTGLVPLRGSDVTGPKTCPLCRSVIHSVRRYGRFLRLAELRSLERKHMLMVDRSLDQFSRNLDKGRDLLRGLKELEIGIRKSPMRKVYEACGRIDGIEPAPPPPARQLIQCLELKGTVLERLSGAYNDESFSEAVKCYEEAIILADDSSSYRFCAIIRIRLGSLFGKFSGVQNVARELAFPLLEWVINESTRFPDLRIYAADLKQKLEEEYEEEIKAVIAAMDHKSAYEYDYGTDSSAHWYECPLGHPYFIGECGRPMQQSRCADCGELVGGSIHTLLGSNRTATGAVGEALNDGA